MSTLDPQAPPSGPSEVAARLQTELSRHGLSQSEVARQLAGPSASSRVVESRRRLLLKWLGAEHAPTEEYAVLLAQILGTPTDYFFAMRSNGHAPAAEARRAVGSDIEAIELARQVRIVSTEATAPKIAFPLRGDQLNKVVPSFNPDQVLLDEVTQLMPGVGAEATATFYPDTPGLGYWYAGTRLVPGLLQLEALAQLAAVLLLTQPENAMRLALTAGFDKTRFRRPLQVGTTITLACRVTQTRGPVAHLVGHGTFQGETTVQTEITLVAD